MMKNNRFYTRFEWLLLIVLFIAGLVSLIFFFKYRDFAFPEDNIHFAINSNQAETKAETFLRDINIRPSGYTHATVFTIDDAAKTFLERNTTTSTAAKLSENTLDLWSFNTRFFKPLQKEEYTVSFLPNGRLSGYIRIIDENSKGVFLPQKNAQAVAEKFLRDTLHIDLSNWHVIDSNSLSRMHRMDYTFTYEKDNFSLHDATYQMKIVVYGDQIGGYSEQLHIPEAWTRSYEQERSQNDLAQTIAEFVAFFLFGITSLVFFVILFRNNQLKLKLGVYVGLVIFLISLIAYLNALPLSLFSYDTTQSFAAFIGGLVVGSIFQSLIPAGICGFIVVIGEYFYRQTFPNKISVENLFYKGLLTKQVNQALLIGGLWGIITFAYIISFYILGSHFGVWSPAEVNYSDAFSTYIPWIYPLYIGLSAAVLEEGIFRLFGIPFLMRFVKKAWIAVLITAFSWSFLHSNYPQSPWFVRGIEVGIEGIVLGFLYLRFGILASFAAHFTFDGLTTAVALWSPAHIFNSVLSTISALLLLLLAGGLLLYAVVKKGFLKDVSALTNHALQSAIGTIKGNAVQPVQAIHTTYQAFLNKKTGIIVGAFIILSIIGMSIGTKQLSVTSSTQTITRQEALARAKNVLMQKAIDTSSFATVVQYTPQPPQDAEQKYLMKHAKPDIFAKIYPQQIPLALWYVRYFKPLSKDEYHVYLRPDGSLYAVDYVLSEDEKGAALTKDQAEHIAIDTLKNDYHENISDYSLVGSSSQKHPKRTDYSFTFEQNENLADQATMHIDLNILGDQPSGYTKYIKLPDTFVREQQKTTTFDFIFGLGFLVSLLALCVYGIVIFFSFVRKKSINFKQGMVMAIPFLTFWLLEKINVLPMFYVNYDTSIPIQTFLFEHIGALIVSFILLIIFVPLLIAFFITLWKKHVSELIPDSLVEKKHMIIDGLFMGYTFPIIILGIASVYGFIQIHYQLISPVFADKLSGIDEIFPAIAIIASVPAAILLGVFTAIFLLLLKNAFKSLKVVLGILLAVSLAVSLQMILSSSASVEAIFITTALNLLLVLLFFFTSLQVIKNNLFAYLVIISMTALLFQSLSLFDLDGILLILNCLVVLLVALLPFGTIFYYYKIRTANR